MKDDLYLKKNHIILYKKATNKFLFPRYYNFGLRLVESGYISSNSLEAARRVISRNIRGIGILHICLKPSFWFTKKPLGSRMGKGKGSLHKLSIPVQAGLYIFEISNITERVAHSILFKASKKLPLKTCIVVKE